MESWENFLKQLIASMGFGDYKVEVDEEHRRGSVYVFDNPGLIKDNLPVIVESLNHLSQLIAQKNKIQALFIDVNNYRKERETLIAELARAAARKALATKQEVSLPAMNSYERRLVHVELAARPDVSTESKDEGKERFVVVRPI